MFAAAAKMPWGAAAPPRFSRCLLGHEINDLGTIGITQVHFLSDMGQYR